MVSAGLLVALVSSLPRASPGDAPVAPIHGGAPVEPGAWPSAAALLLDGYLCTGTLVSERVILTAAHCLFRRPPVERVQVVFGEHAYAPVPRRSVLAYGLHPEYCSDEETCIQDNHDLGYVVLADPVTDIAPTPVLASQSAWDEAMRVGAPVRVVGFGLSEAGSTGQKREVEVEISRFSAGGLEFQAGGSGRDSCEGDSGGPAFVRLSTGEWVLGGVTSRGSACGEGGIYGAPYAALCWLHAETGLDLRPAACEACDCLDTTPPEGCGCASGDAGGLAALALLLARRRRRPAPSDGS